MPRVLFALLCALPLLGSPAAQAEEPDLYSWSEVAPVVVSGTSLGEDGRYVEFRAERVFRGSVQPGAELLLDQREANRSRDRMVDPKPLRLVAEERFVILLEPAYKRKRDGATIFRILRGVRGARPLPKESEQALLAALERIIAIQELESENRKWSQMTALLEGNDPLLLSVALEQFLRFRRGEPDLLPVVLPLLDHPGPGYRAQASRLIGQIVELNRGEELPDGPAVRAELIARARRDESAAVREAATRALAGFPSADIVDVLEEISADDPDQEVRYTAQLLLLELREDGYQGRRFAGSSD